MLSIAMIYLSYFVECGTYIIHEKGGSLLFYFEKAINSQEI